MQAPCGNAITVANGKFGSFFIFSPKMIWDEETGDRELGARLASAHIHVIERHG